ncbi:MAG: hypothetical protein MJ137_02735 [Clostridia bacterium]|nr:hypothetical protein [Clostridia bacterium]
MSYNRRTLSPDSPYAIIAALLMFFSAALSTVSYAWYSFAFDWKEIAVGYVLPVTACVIMAIMLLSRKNNLMPTIIPMLIGVVYFALRSVNLEVWQCVLSCVLYASFAIIYILTVSGFLDSRTPLMVISGAPLLFRIFVVDIFVNDYSDFLSFLPELSVLFILAAIVIETRGMRRGRLY